MYDQYLTLVQNHIIALQVDMATNSAFALNFVIVVCSLLFHDIKDGWKKKMKLIADLQSLILPAIAKLMQHSSQDPQNWCSTPLDINHRIKTIKVVDLKMLKLDQEGILGKFKGLLSREHVWLKRGKRPQNKGFHRYLRSGKEYSKDWFRTLIKQKVCSKLQHALFWYQTVKGLCVLWD